MKRIIKRLKDINWNKSIEIKIRPGIETEIIELTPTGSIHRETKVFIVKWLIFFIEFSAECKG